jgi:hypothetical protein
MKPNCDEIRERAFRDGLDSRAAAEWRAHCRSCPDCRTELFILENLERQAIEERQHLGRDEVAKLLASARNYQRRERTPNRVLVWGLRAACVSALLLVATALLPGELGGGMRQRLEALLDGDAPANGMPTQAARPAVSQPSAPVPAAATVPDEDLDRQLRGLRQGLDRRRQSLERLLERDFGPFNPEGAFHAVPRLAHANA